jgi:hypothetical protein
MLSQTAQDEERLEFPRSFAELQHMGSSSIWSATEVRFERSRFETGVRSRSVERLAATAIERRCAGAFTKRARQEGHASRQRRSVQN